LIILSGFVVVCSTGFWTQGLHLEPLYQPFFVRGFFKIRSPKLFVPGWLWTVILLLSASQVAKITDMSHQSSAEKKCFKHVLGVELCIHYFQSWVFAPTCGNLVLKMCPLWIAPWY
jgi:hypothetical protein